MGKTGSVSIFLSKVFEPDEFTITQSRCLWPIVSRAGFLA
uniref:Uncharacterized protein n=1 Tax=Utricularia reniformis TaxID=192314 RepID=A0A1Y0AZI9_9LAMI|nr:hypothetical protein AEK19_MT0273 [Utricularia reniformis]ART30549.1 hypothetical protein AEK19_MT0273 [Utricularia reniformis]